MAGFSSRNRLFYHFFLPQRTQSTQRYSATKASAFAKAMAGQAPAQRILTTVLGTPYGELIRRRQGFGGTSREHRGIQSAWCSRQILLPKPALS